MSAFFTGSDAGKAGLEVKDGSGSPDVKGVTKINVSSGTLTDNGGGEVTITTGGGGGGGSIGGSITEGQVAVGAATADDITGSNSFLFSETGGLTVTSGLTGNDPLINLSSNTKAITLKVETNKQLSVDGGSNKFVFDASSAIGGITFPDGSIQRTAGMPKLADISTIDSDTTVTSSDSGTVFVATVSTAADLTVTVPGTVGTFAVGTQVVIIKNTSGGAGALKIATDGSGLLNGASAATTITIGSPYQAYTVVLVKTINGYNEWIAIG